MTAAQAISELRARLGLIAPELLPLVETIDRELKPVSKASDGESGQVGVRYAVEISVLGETLAEHRLSGKSKPFRCSKSLYELVAQVLASANHAMSVTEIATAVEKISGDRPAEFQTRVPLRLWSSSGIGLLNRHLAKYRPLDKHSFVSATSELWSRMASKAR